MHWMTLIILIGVVLIDAKLWKIVMAQRECKRRGLLPGWPPPKP